jgi:hypothetical protein
MNKEEQRIAIAEACGYEFKTHEGKSYCFFEELDGWVYWENIIPHYLDDLNAMHKAEEVLTEEQLYDYGNALDRVTLPKTRMEMCYVHGPEAGMYPDLFRATAAQRAEAFLRTIKKWTTNPNDR